MNAFGVAGKYIAELDNVSIINISTPHATAFCKPPHPMGKSMCTLQSTSIPSDTSPDNQIGNSIIGTTALISRGIVFGDRTKTTDVFSALPVRLTRFCAPRPSSAVALLVQANG